jgi:hypothetical protein
MWSVRSAGDKLYVTCAFFPDFLAPTMNKFIQVDDTKSKESTIQYIVGGTCSNSVGRVRYDAVINPVVQLTGVVIAGTTATTVATVKIVAIGCGGCLHADVMLVAEMVVQSNQLRSFQSIGRKIGKDALLGIHIT